MIDVIWWNGARGNWDSGLLCEIFDKYPNSFNQHNSKELLWTDRAIVVIVGSPSVLPLQEYLATLKSGLVIFTGDEECSFDAEAIRFDNLEYWTQCYASHRSWMQDRLLLGCPNRISNYKINTHLPKKYLWSFVGQVQNPFRQACVDALNELPDGFMHIVPQFGGGEGGIEYQEYIDIMCQSHFVICPSGSMTADTFRVYEAIECGAIPIADHRSPRDDKAWDYWNVVYPSHNLLRVSEWNGWGLEHLMRAYVKNIWPSWWPSYKQQLSQKLLNYAFNKH